MGGLVNMRAICLVDDLPGGLEWLKHGRVLLILRSLPKIRKVEIIEGCIT